MYRVDRRQTENRHYRLPLETEERETDWIMLAFDSKDENYSIDNFKEKIESGIYTKANCITEGQ